MEMKCKLKKPGYAVCISVMATLDTSLGGKGAENIIFTLHFLNISPSADFSGLVDHHIM